MEIPKLKKKKKKKLSNSVGHKDATLQVCQLYSKLEAFVTQPFSTCKQHFMETQTLC